MVRLVSVALCLLAVYLTYANACRETVPLAGYLEQDVITTIAAPRQRDVSGSTCHCCALCYKTRGCASLSANTTNGECRLHSTVAGYDTLTPDSSWKYFVMPGHSQHHQFCRQDSDCLVKGEFCRGRVCTNQTTVTCRTIVETFGAGTRFGRYPFSHGWASSTLLTLPCHVRNGQGFTRLFRYNQNIIITREMLDFFNPNPGSKESHSLLRFSDAIIRSSSEPTYQVLMRLDMGPEVFFSAVPRDLPLVADEPRREPWGTLKCGKVEALCLLSSISLPFRGTGENLLLVTAVAQETPVDGGTETFSLARTDGRLFHNQVDRSIIFVRE
ncbi:hypothetical protein FJT64_015028 [Amphibalanus amphitrite]|uniref:Apple domain-containing protein n=1 Tax=Amphibalanus amphitrite TaxID=1232801 RepID=A0A6A4X473_AMPAM|nr:hypothetical protein FJT64_015028 [Amphibalanus amphitrite]